MLLVEDFFEKYKESLRLCTLTEKSGFRRRIQNAHCHRAGIFLTGFIDHYTPERILVFGYQESQYLQSLKPEDQYARLVPLLTDKMPMVMVSQSFQPIDALVDLCRQKDLAIVEIPKTTVVATHLLSSVLTDEFAPTCTRHGTFIEVYDVGVLIEGDSSVGKSETALGLIEKGHRLVTDDVVHITRKRDHVLEGCGVELTRHHMEIRGIGIINIANIYGAYSVRNKKNIDMIITLETWKDDQYYDRLGLDDKMDTILEVKVPQSTLPVKPGRDVVLLIETIALNHRLQRMGYHSANEFKARQNAMIEKKSLRMKAEQGL